MRCRTATSRPMCLVVLATFLTLGCTTSMQQPGQAALICGAGGALTGAALGAAVGSTRNATGALVGALVGGLTGGLLAATTCFAIAHYKSQQVKDYEQTRTATNYNTQQGDIVQITHYAIVPAAAAPESEVAFNATYSVMTPNADQDIRVTETRSLKMYDPGTQTYKELGRVATQVTMKPGTRQADGAFKVGSGVGEGRYLVVFEVARDSQSATKDLPLIVTKDQAVLRQGPNQKAEFTTGSVPVASSGPPPISAPGAPSAGAVGPLAAIGEKDPQRPLAPAGPGLRPAVAKVSTERYFIASKVSGRGNVREAPGRGHKILGEITQGDRYLIVDAAKDATGSWYKIRLDTGREGWVAGSLGVEVLE